MQLNVIGIGDLNGDNQLDLIIYSDLYKSIFLFFGNGNGGFRTTMMLVSEDIGTSASTITADFNHDGHLDLAITGYYTSKLIIFLGNDGRTFDKGITYKMRDGSYLGEIVAGDFNGDYHLDIAIAIQRSCSLGVLLGYGNGTFAAPIMSRLDNNSCRMSIVMGDFNRDSRLDIASTSYQKSQGDIWFGYGNGTFTAPITLPTNRYSFPTWIVSGDFNNDSYLNIAVANQGNYNLGIFLGQGNGTFQAQLTFSTNYFAPYSLVTGDFNDDAILDLACNDHDSRNVGVLLGYGNGSFETQMTFSFGDLMPGLWLAGNDLNRDERLDLILVGSDHTRILWNTCECCVSKFPNTSAFTHR